MQAIRGFFGPWRFLSNFHYVNVELDGATYRTTEHAYQAAKTLNLDERRLIQSVDHPRDARKLGQLVRYRPGWEEMKDAVMYDLNCQKYGEEPLRSMLLQTRDAYLEETNTWKDIYWGVCNGVGQNKLGILLMDIRQGLREVEGSTAGR